MDDHHFNRFGYDRRCFVLCRYSPSVPSKAFDWPAEYIGPCPLHVDLPGLVSLKIEPDQIYERFVANLQNSALRRDVWQELAKGEAKIKLPLPNSVGRLTIRIQEVGSKRRTQYLLKVLSRRMLQRR